MIVSVRVAVVVWMRLNKGCFRVLPLIIAGFDDLVIWGHLEKLPPSISFRHDLFGNAL